MKQGQLSLDKWHFKLGFVYNRWSRRFMIHFGIFKMKSFPKEREIITKENYIGFWWIKEIEKGFEISL